VAASEPGWMAAPGLGGVLERAGQPVSLDAGVGDVAGELLRVVPDPGPDDGHDGGHDGEPDDGGVGEDADGEGEAECLDGGLDSVTKATKMENMISAAAVTTRADFPVPRGTARRASPCLV